MARLVKCGIPQGPWDFIGSDEKSESKSVGTVLTAEELHYQAVSFCKNKDITLMSSHMKCIDSYKNYYKNYYKELLKTADA